MVKSKCACVCLCVHASVCVCVSMWPHGSNSRREWAAAKRWLTAVMSSSLQTDICQKPSLWRRIWGSSQPGDGLLYDCSSVPRGFTCSRATPVISLCRWNYVCINLHYILSYHNISWAFIIVLIMHCRLLHHVIMLLLLQKQCSMKPQLDLQWWLLTWTPLFARKTIYIPVICFCFKLLSAF